jgi:hypothetical protein
VSLQSRVSIAAAALAIAAGLAASVDAQSRPRKIFASLVDKKGVAVTTVAAADVVVREDGVAREVLSVEPAKDPMRVVLLVDNSQAASTSIQYFRDALGPFAARLTGAGHSVGLVTLGDRPTSVVEPTTELARLKSKGIDRLFAQPASGMYLLDALLDASRGFAKNETPRPVLIALVTEGTEFGNVPADTVLKAIKDSGALFHALVLTEGPRADDSAQETRERNIVLDRGTRENGGQRDLLISHLSVKERLDRLAGELLAQVAITYASPERLVPADKITITAAKDGFTARGVAVKVARGPVPER